jgi:Hint module
MAIAGHCCDSGYTYVGGTCCLNANVCGSVCCPAGQTCSNGQCVGGGCFVAGTPVVMAGGYHKSIDSIQVGDTILAWNEDTKQIFSTPVVEALHHEERMQTLFDIELENRGKFTVNDYHPMYVTEDEGFIVSRELAGRFGKGKPITFLGNNNEPVKLVSLRMRTERCKVYNLHVQGQGEKGHTYFANGILVHNKITAPTR